MSRKPTAIEVMGKYAVSVIDTSLGSNTTLERALRRSRNLQVAPEVRLAEQFTNKQIGRMKQRAALLEYKTSNALKLKEQKL